VEGFVDARYGAGYPMIVTSNIDPEDLKNATGYERAASRLWEMCGGREGIIALTGPDLRLKK
jgi:DNA replication protein DnaC